MLLIPVSITSLFINQYLGNELWSTIDTKCENKLPVRTESSAVIWKDSLIIWGGKELDQIIGLYRPTDSIYSLHLDKQLKEGEIENINTSSKQNEVEQKGNENSYFAQLSSLLFQDLYSDIKFQFEGHEDISAHKFVLGVRCRYFHNMFTSNFVAQQYLYFIMVFQVR